MKITYNNKEYEAYALLMRKENAIDIISGKKRVEIREFSPFYEKMFIDQKIVEQNRKIKCESEYVSPMRDVPCIHFYSTGAPWTLDVSINDIGIASMIEEDIKWLNEEYGFHDFDNEWQQYVGKPEEEIPIFFYLGIEKVLQHEGI